MLFNVFQKLYEVPRNLICPNIMLSLVTLVIFVKCMSRKQPNVLNSL